MPPPDDGAPQSLQDMRHVYQNEKAWDTTTSQEHMRQFLDKHPAQFVAQMTDLEERQRSWKERQQKPEEDETDEGTERALALCEAWLRENGVQQ